MFLILDTKIIVTDVQVKGRVYELYMGGTKIFLQVKDMDLRLDLKPYWFHLVPKMGENTISLLVIWGQELLISCILFFKALDMPNIQV